MVWPKVTATQPYLILTQVIKILYTFFHYFTGDIAVKDISGNNTKDEKGLVIFLGEDVKFGKEYDITI